MAAEALGDSGVAGGEAAVWQRRHSETVVWQGVALSVSTCSPTVLQRQFLGVSFVNRIRFSGSAHVRHGVPGAHIGLALV